MRSSAQIRESVSYTQHFHAYQTDIQVDTRERKRAQLSALCPLGPRVTAESSNKPLHIYEKMNLVNQSWRKKKKTVLYSLGWEFKSTSLENAFRNMKLEN